MQPNQIAILIDESPMNRGLDGKTWTETTGNIALGNRFGDVVLFQRAAAGVYEFHWLIMRSRGRKAIEWTLSAIDNVFLDTGCRLMFGMIPIVRRDSQLMARWIGAKFAGNVATEYGECAMFIMTREMRQGG